MTMTKAEVMSQFESSPGFELFKKRAKESIEQEKTKFWNIENKDEAETQRLKAIHFEDFWNDLQCFIINMINQK